MRLLTALSFVSLLLTSCSSDPEQQPGGAVGGGGSGTLYFAFSVELEIHKVDLATGNDAKLGTGDAPHSTSDGKIIFATPQQLAESDETLASHRIIVASDNTGMKPWTVGFRAPQVSPDGTKIVYTTLLDNMYVVSRADGTVLKKFEATGAAAGWHRPTWTPDGRIVAGGDFTNKGIYISDAALTTMTRIDPMLSDPKDPAVSPDGKKVVLVLNDRLHVMNIDGSGMKRIDQSDDKDTQPSWSPDGTKVVYRASGTIKIMSAEGGPSSDLLDLSPALASKHRVLTGSNPIQWK
jgi:Tol biopolymer transport system component